MLHLDNDGHTESKVTVWASYFQASVIVRMLPGYRSWSRPSAANVRKWVDAAIAESAYPSWRRLSPAHVTSTDTGWTITFRLGD